jgi:hypothetical protein
MEIDARNKVDQLAGKNVDPKWETSRACINGCSIGQGIKNLQRKFLNGEEPKFFRTI